MKIREIANFLKGDLKGDGEIEISRIASLENSQKGDLSFVENSTLLEEEPNSISASCLLVPMDFSSNFPVSQIKVNNPKLAFAKIGGVLYPPKDRGSGIHESSVLAESAVIGTDVLVGAFCSVGEDSSIGKGTQILPSAKIGDNVKVGDNCLLHPNVFIEDNSTIGNNVTLHPGVVIGADGFGFVRDKNSYIKFPQIGVVVIEDNVEIGANSCVDRGALGETRIGEGTKIDNLVQIAHNVTIGKRVVIASQTGISGSVTIEDDCVIGGQVGFGDHSRVKSGAVIGSKAGVLPGKIVREGVWWGVPVQPLSDYKRQNAYVKSLPRIKQKIKEIERVISELENK